MRRLSRVVLTRGDQTAVLQGMIHMAPDKLYELSQRDVDWAESNNYQVFFEGVKIKKDSPKRASTANECKIKQFFLFLFDLYPVFAATLGISLQKERIAYPEDAINADITFSEFTQLLDKNGFNCNFLLWLFKMIDKEELMKRTNERFANSGGWNAWMNSSDRWSLNKLFIWFLLRKAMPIIMGYRNEVAMIKVRAHSNGRNIFIHYGEKHVEGLVRLLQKDGWLVEGTVHTDLAKLC